MYNDEIDGLYFILGRKSAYISKKANQLRVTAQNTQNSLQQSQKELASEINVNLKLVDLAIMVLRLLGAGGCGEEMHSSFASRAPSAPAGF